MNAKVRGRRWCSCTAPTASHTRWAPVLGALEARHTVYTMDRRGRGASGDAPAYDVEREFEDVAAVVDAVAAETGVPVDLLGHSFGGMCAMEAAPAHIEYPTADRLRRGAGRRAAGPDRAGGALQAQVNAGDRDGAVQTMMREVVRVPEEQLALLRSLPTWQARVAAAHTISRELHATNTYRMDQARMRTIGVPTLLLLGGDSPTFFGASTEAAYAALPDSRIVVLPEQRHAAMDTAPDLFVREVVAFLDAHEPGAAPPRTSQ